MSDWGKRIPMAKINSRNIQENEKIPMKPLHSTQASNFHPIFKSNNSQEGESILKSFEEWSDDGGEYSYSQAFYYYSIIEQLQSAINEIDKKNAELTMINLQLTQLKSENEARLQYYKTLCAENDVQPQPY